MQKASCPCKDWSNRVSWSFFPLLVFSVVTSHRAMCGFCLNTTIWRQQYRCHQSERTVTLSNNIRLNITVIIFAGPNKTSIAFHGISNHIINKSMFIPEFTLFKLCFIVFLVNLFKNVLKSSIVFLQYSVLCCQIKRVISLNCEFKRWMGEFINWLICIVHSHENSRPFEFVNFHYLTWVRFFIRLESDKKFACLTRYVICCAILISKSVSTNDNWFSPSGNKSWNVLDHNWFTEYSTTKLISNCSVGRLPHLF